jgi:hypothetical protein
MEKKEIRPDDNTLAKAFRAVRLHVGTTTLVEDLTEGTQRIIEVPIIEGQDMPPDARNVTPKDVKLLP